MGIVSPAGMASLFAVMLAAGYESGVPADAVAGPSIVSPPVRFLTTGARDFWPCFSPDSTQILFSRRVGESWELFLVPAAGGQAVKLSAAPLPVAATRAGWSKRGNLIAFTGTSVSGKSTVWLVKPDGSSARAVERSDLSDQVFYPSWYPDGEQLAVMDAASFSIKRFKLVGGVAATLTDPKKVYTGMPSISPDGKWIVFAGQVNKGQQYDQTKNSIWLMDDTGVPHTLESGPGQGRAPTWSPSGEQLLFESDRASSAGLYAIFLINRDGTGITQLTDPALNADHPVWSPDGQHIAFSAHDTARLGAVRSIGIIMWPEVRASTASR
jgi:Tol biopolymer transport system component